MAADRATGLLPGIGFPEQRLAAVAHAIAAHSYSAGIPTETLEAEILQDADRLDAVGAIGLARTIAVGAELGRPLFHPTDRKSTRLNSSHKCALRMPSSTRKKKQH